MLSKWKLLEIIRKKQKPHFCEFVIITVALLTAKFCPGVLPLTDQRHAGKVNRRCERGRVCLSVSIDWKPVRLFALWQGEEAPELYKRKKRDGWTDRWIHHIIVTGSNNFKTRNEIKHETFNPWQLQLSVGRTENSCKKENCDCLHLGYCVIKTERKETNATKTLSGKIEILYILWSFQSKYEPSLIQCPRLVWGQFYQKPVYILKARL